MGQSIDEKLFAYIDGHLNKESTEELEIEMDADPGLKARYEQLKNLHRKLKDTGLEKPSFEFSDKVMKNLNNPKYIPATIENLFDKQRIFTLLMIIMGISIGIYILSTGLPNISFLEQVNLNSLNISDRTIDFSPLKNFVGSDFFFKAFLFFDLILAILILDRLVFRPLFKGKMRTFAI